jgi:high-affinity K+ transport system ATPase subunit B
MSANRPFKHHERTVAKRLGGQRTGHTGGADVVTDWLCIECKHRKEVPAWLVDALAQAKRNATAEQLPLAIIHQSGERYSEDLVILRMADFEHWFGDTATAVG